MCKWGEEENVLVTIPQDLSYTGKERQAIKGIDKCIAPIVRALNRGGIKTSSCCCGHGKIYGSILLIDGRELIIKGEKDRDEDNSYAPDKDSEVLLIEPLQIRLRLRELYRKIKGKARE